MRGPTLSLLILALVVGAGQARAQDDSVFIAFGDSITRGDSRFDQQNKGGYPGRLQSKLRATDPGAVVHNAGRDGESTAEGLSRISNALSNFPSDAILIMEGTNDVSDVINGLISFESIGSNLETMGNRAANAGRNVFYGTIIPRPPSARHDKNNHLTFALVREIRAIAHKKKRELVDPYDELIFTVGAFSTLYTKDANDTVGHPNAAGFAVLADLFFDSVRGMDTRGPVPGELDPSYLTNKIKPADDLELILYDFGAGIDEDNTTLTINGIEVATELSGDEREMTLFHDTTAQTLGCNAKVGVRAADLADPPNISEHVYAEFLVSGGNILTGDLNRTCRVDGADLLIVALAFGSKDGEARYSKTADIDNDGKVDGRDVAELAENFGRSS